MKEPKYKIGDGAYRMYHDRPEFIKIYGIVKRGYNEYVNYE